MGCVPQGCTDVLSTASSAALKLWWRWELAHPALHRLWCFWVQNCQLLQGWGSRSLVLYPFCCMALPRAVSGPGLCVHLPQLSPAQTQHSLLPFPPPPGMVTCKGTQWLQPSSRWGCGVMLLPWFLSPAWEGPWLWH